MAIMLRLTLVALVLGVAAAHLSLRRGVQKKASTDPFDCYSKDGADYIGLRDTSASGRKCANWSDKMSEDGVNISPTDKGMGNHAYCRNPDGSMDKPWCFTVDPNKEKEECVIKECADRLEAPEPWVAPEGSKSEEAEAKGPCEYKPTEAPMVEFKAGQQCEASKGDKVWLVGNKLGEADDAEKCRENCRMSPGTEFFTYFDSKDDDGGNCGCYRECILVDADLSTNGPTVYKLN